DLSLMKEYANRQDVFDDALAQHLTLLFGAVLPALVIGVPLGIWCYFSTECQHCSGRTGCQKSGCRLPETKRV
ncbi:hypothetical protein ACUOA8_61415, partial [Escherichia sp. SS-MK2]